MQGEYTLATRYLEETLNLQRELSEPRGAALTLRRFGAIATLQGDFDRAEVYLTEALTFFQQFGESWGLGSILVDYGVLTVVQGKLLQALSPFKEAMLLAQEIKQRYNLAIALAALGCALGVASSARYTALLCSTAEILFEQTGTALPPAYHSLYLTYLMSIQAQVDEETWQRWWEQGKSLASEQAVALALEGCQHSLSQRELEDCDWI